MQDSFLDFFKVLLVFLLFFGFASLAFLFSLPKQGDYYSVLFLVPEKSISKMRLDYGKNPLINFDENNNCFKRLPDLFFSFGIKNSTGQDKNYSVSYFVTNNIALEKNFKLLGKETVFVAVDDTFEIAKQFSLSKECISLPSFVVVDAKDENNEFRVYFSVSSPDVSTKSTSVLLFDQSTTKPAIAITPDQNKNLIYDKNIGCFFNYPALNFSFRLSNFEKTGANYNIRYFVTRSLTKLDSNSLVYEELVYLQNNEVMAFDKNLQISRLCLKLPFFVVIDVKALKTSIRKNFVVNNVNVLARD